MTELEINAAVTWPKPKDLLEAKLKSSILISLVEEYPPDPPMNSAEEWKLNLRFSRTMELYVNCSEPLYSASLKLLFQDS